VEIGEGGGQTKPKPREFLVATHRQEDTLTRRLVEKVGRCIVYPGRNEEGEIANLH